MDMSSVTRDHHIRVRVSGRIDAAESPAFGAELQSHLDGGAVDITIDLGDVDYLDSSGLAVLVRSWRVQTARGRRFSIALPTDESARRIFSLTGFDAVFDIDERDTVEQG